MAVASKSRRSGVFIPTAPAKYDPIYMGTLNNILSNNDSIVQKTNNDYVITTKLILQSPNGTFYQIKVDNSGNLSTSSITL